MGGIALSALLKIIANPDLLKGLSMPNIPFPTLGGEVFWNNLAVSNGWKVQQNQFTHHVRILDSDNVRRAWGSEAAMMELFNKIVK